MKLNPNIHAVRSLAAAQNAIHVLDGMGCAVLEVKLCGRNPVLIVDCEPQGVAGAYCSQERRGGLLVRQMVATVDGCEVRWDVRCATNVVEFGRAPACA